LSVQNVFHPYFEEDERGAAHQRVDRHHGEAVEPEQQHAHSGTLIQKSEASWSMFEKIDIQNIVIGSKLNYNSFFKKKYFWLVFSMACELCLKVSKKHK